MKVYYPCPTITMRLTKRGETRFQNLAPNRSRENNTVTCQPKVPPTSQFSISLVPLELPLVLLIERYLNHSIPTNAHLSKNTSILSHSLRQSFSRPTVSPSLQQQLPQPSLSIPFQPAWPVLIHTTVPPKSPTILRCSVSRVNLHFDILNPSSKSHVRNLPRRLFNRINRPNKIINHIKTSRIPHSFYKKPTSRTVCLHHKPQHTQCLPTGNTAISSWTGNDQLPMLSICHHIFHRELLCSTLKLFLFLL